MVAVVGLLSAVFRRMATVEDQVVEVWSTRDAVDLLVLVGRRARAIHDVGDEEGVHAWSSVPAVVGLGRIATLPARTSRLIRSKIAVSVVVAALLSRRAVSLGSVVVVTGGWLVMVVIAALTVTMAVVMAL